MSDISLKGTVLGFEEYSQYALRNIFDDSSPLRILASMEERLGFLVVNPFVVRDDYQLEIDDAVAGSLDLIGDGLKDVAVLCVARKGQEKGTYVVNLRAPLIINTVEGRFQQVILQNEAYGMEVAFFLDKERGAR